ncbi:hypothetical protein ACQ86D_44955 [Streptomyces galilaeus]
MHLYYWRQSRLVRGIDTFSTTSPAEPSTSMAAWTASSTPGSDTGVPNPSFIRNGRVDILATNRLGRALYDPVFADPARPVNLARHEFLNPGAADFLPQLERQAAGATAFLRTEAGRDPCNRDLTDLVGELSTRSEKFRTLWAAHDVRLHQTGVKHFHHPSVGELALPFEAMPIPTEPGLTLTALSAEPGTPAHDSL